MFDSLPIFFFFFFQVVLVISLQIALTAKPTLFYSSLLQLLRSFVPPKLRSPLPTPSHGRLRTVVPGTSPTRRTMCRGRLAVLCPTSPAPRRWPGRWSRSGAPGVLEGRGGWDGFPRFRGRAPWLGGRELIEEFEVDYDGLQSGMRKGNLNIDVSILATSYTYIYPC